MLDIDEYLAVRKEAFKNDGIIPTAANAPDLAVWDQTRNVNWQKRTDGKRRRLPVILSRSFRRRYPHASFRISAAHTNTVDLQSIDGHNKSTSLNFSVGHSTQDQKLSVDLSGTYAFMDVNAILDRTSGFLLPPNAPAIYDEKRQSELCSLECHQSSFWLCIRLPSYQQ